MSVATPKPDADAKWLPKSQLQVLLDLLWARKYRVIGPTVSQGAIIYDEVRTTDDLPRGWTEVQAAGKYRLQRRSDDAWFGFTVGPHSWKQYLFPPQSTVATAERTAEGWQMNDVPADETAFAFGGHG